MKRILLGVPLAFLLLSVPLTAATVTLVQGDWLTIKPVGGQLSVLVDTPTLVKVQCAAGEPVDTPELDADTPANQTVTLKPGQKAVVKPSGGLLVIRKNSATQIKVFCDIAATAGKWKGTTNRGYPVSFNVKTLGTKWTEFACQTDFRVGGCRGKITVTLSGPADIVGRKFSADLGDYSFTGQITSATTAKGTWKFKNYYIMFCGYLTVSGTWTATWDGALESEETRRPAGSRHDVIVLEECDGNDVDMPR